MQQNIFIEYGISEVRGYSSFAFEVRNNTPLTPEAQVLIDDQTGSTTSISIRGARSVEELASSLNTSAEAKGAVYGAEVDASLGFLSKSSFSSNQSYLILNIVANRGRKLVSPGLVKVTDEAAKLSPAAFFRLYGDHYVGEIFMGGMLSMVFTVIGADSSSNQEINGKLSVTVPATGSASGSVKSQISSMLSNSKFTLDVVQSGGIDATRDVLSGLDAAIDWAFKWLDSIGDNRKAYAATAFPLSQVPGVPAGLAPMLEQPSARLGAIGKLITQYLDTRGRIDFAREQGDNAGLDKDEQQAVKKLFQRADDDVDTLQNALRKEDPTSIPDPSDLSKKLGDTVDGYEKKLDAVFDPSRLRVSYGDDFVLQWDDSTFVSPSSKEDGRFWPRADKDSVKLRFTQGTGNLKDGTRVFVESNESQLGNDNRLSGSSNYPNGLLWRDRSGDDKQTWVIRKEKSGDGILRYGDELALESAAWTGQEVFPTDKKFINTKKPGSGHLFWTIRRP